MNCKYCNRKGNDFVALNNTVQYSGIEIDINRQGMLRVRTYDESDFLLQDIVNIQFCPICGRKLTEEE